MRRLRQILPGLAAAALGTGAAFLGVSHFLAPPEPALPVHVEVPALKGAAAAGEAVFAASCAVCHGRDAAGSEQGPPLVHRIYEPGHHGDAAFALAVARGVRQHHWSFGDMPPQPGVSPREVEQIVAYVRALQRANGIR